MFQSQVVFPCFPPFFSGAGGVTSRCRRPDDRGRAPPRAPGAELLGCRGAAAGGNATGGRGMCQFLGNNVTI